MKFCEIFNWEDGRSATDAFSAAMAGSAEPAEAQLAGSGRQRTGFGRRQKRPHVVPVKISVRIHAKMYKAIPHFRNLSSICV